MAKGKTNTNGLCVEAGVWTPLPNAVPDTTNLVFPFIGSGNLTFHTVGCTGDPKHSGPGSAVAAGMAAQITTPVSPAVTPSFFYHLGDIAYTSNKSDTMGALWNTQFYAQYKTYANGGEPLPIFAIAGNHDGKAVNAPDTEISHFEQNMCAKSAGSSKDNQADPARKETTQPYPYWRLDTPLAWIIGLYANVSNGGVLDDPTEKDPHGPQYQWLVTQLNWCKTQNASGTPRAILLALHYPPYNGTIDFLERGNPTFGGDAPPWYPAAVPLGMIIQDAFNESSQTPDAIFAAHAHLYQRLTLAYTDSSGNVIRQVPCFIAGCGGHTQLELMATKCGSGVGTVPPAPFDLFAQHTTPVDLAVPTNGSMTVEFYADGTDAENQPYGFLTITLTPGTSVAHPTLVCQFYTTPCDSSGKQVKQAAVSDSCTLDLTTHLLLS
jgi:hypothetical protein